MGIPQQGQADPETAGLREALGRIARSDLDDVTAACELAAVMQRAATALATSDERREAKRLAGLVTDDAGRHFTMAFTDQALRAQRDGRFADQMRYLLTRYGVPRYLGAWQRFQLGLFRAIGRATSALSVPLVRRGLRQEVAKVVLPAEPAKLRRALAERGSATQRINLNHLGESILGEGEADDRLESYLAALARADIDAASVKISSIASHLELLAFDHTLDRLAPRLRSLYRAAIDHPVVSPSPTLGPGTPKLVTLDMEAFEDVELTRELFKRVLDEPEFATLHAGIVVQAYLPDSVALVADLLGWATHRVVAGGAPIHIRLVKGANLMMERVEAAHHGWSQAPYPDKVSVDANFKRLVDTLLAPQNGGEAAPATLGVGSHNVFDIAYALVVATRRRTRERLSFEMLEGIAGPVRRVVEGLTGDVLLYAPTVASADVQSALAYLIRRLDENTAADNFLRHSFGVEAGSPAWVDQQERFTAAWAKRNEVSSSSRRTSWVAPLTPTDPRAPFVNAVDTDWSVAANRVMVHAAIAERRAGWAEPLSSVIDGAALEGEGVDCQRVGVDPSRPGVALYHYSVVGTGGVEHALACADSDRSWSLRTVADRVEVLGRVAVELERGRFELIAAMVADAGKSIREADIEVSEAVDFAEYYRRSVTDWSSVPGVTAKPLGVVVVAPPWNFPLAIPAGGVLAALVVGNRVILKPAPETIAVAWELAQALWRAGVDRHALQLLLCDNDPAGSALVADPRVDAVILTGSTATARKLLGLRPDLWLLAETGGKNALIVTQMADVDQAIKVAVGGAFGHAGQKCSATSLLIVEAPLFDDPSFRERLQDAVISLPVGPSWAPESVVTPLIRQPAGPLARALNTDAGANGDSDLSGSWLVEPQVAADNPRLVSPGVRWGVVAGSFFHTTELFGPVLSVMRADNLDDAIALANQTGYGLTAGLMSLDEREQKRFIETLDAGCLYLNRKTTGAVVQRQPFGGRHASVFGPGAKAGGPAYLSQLQRFADAGADVTNDYEAAFAEHYAAGRDVTQLLGQDNILRYQPLTGLVVRVVGDQDAVRHDSDIRRVVAALKTVGAAARWSCTDEATRAAVLSAGVPDQEVEVESTGVLLATLTGRRCGRLRVLGHVGSDVYRAAASTGVCVDDREVVSRGVVELLRYLQPQTISNDFHRFGNLGDRANDSLEGASTVQARRPRS